MPVTVAGLRPMSCECFVRRPHVVSGSRPTSWLTLVRLSRWNLDELSEDVRTILVERAAVQDLAAWLAFLSA